MNKKKLKRMCSALFAGVLLVSSVPVSGITVNKEVYAAEADDSAAQEKTQVQDTQNVQKLENSLTESNSDDSGLLYKANGEVADFRDETIYFVITTRFYDGDPSNNVQCWTGQDKNANDPPWRGDFKGLIDKLDYIKALGFTAVWITPVVENASDFDYHGYHAFNFKKVDKRYESDDCTYQDLIDAVHARGMKIIQDVVFNHTCNYGEENLYPIFSKDDTMDLENNKCMIANESMDGMAGYNNIQGVGNDSADKRKFLQRLKVLNADAGSDTNHKYDVRDIFHHNGFVGSSFEQYIVQTGSMHYADCIDLNTENPTVYKYLVEAYGQYIKMGVDAFRVDTVKHVSRLTFNKAIVPQLNEIYNQTHGTTGEGNFYMFGEVCTRYRNVWNDGKPYISTPFYTWKESKDYAWDDNETAEAIATNTASAEQNYLDNSTTANQPTSDNVFLRGNDYHKPDYSMASGLSTIDFPMHWSFRTAGEAYQQAKEEDKYYNDSTFNVTYVDSHDYAPDNAPEKVRFAGSQATWAENLNLMFTFRGIPCLYYGSEIEFKKGCVIDEGPNLALENSGRAYFGDNIEGSVETTDFGYYTNATGNMKDTLNYPLSLHIQRLNRLRASVPALRKGQYSTEGCDGQFAYKRRYTDDTTDSFALIALTSDATFTGIPGGKYTDAITGDVQVVSNGTLKTSGMKGQGDLRVYVLDTDLTKAPGMIEGKSTYMSGGCDITVDRIMPTGISVDKSSATLDIGDKVTVSATVQPANATSKTVSWKSDNTSVATVNSKGVITATGEGTTKIYAATSNATKSDYDKGTGLVSVITVTVKATGVRVTSLTLNKTAITLDAGKAFTLKTTVLPPNASEKYAKLTYASADTNVATVSDKGIVTAHKSGKTTITVTSADGAKATADVTVRGTVIYGNAIYFEKPANWGKNINIYMWDEKGDYKNASWPGVKMSVIDEDKGIYGIEYPDNNSATMKVIFNDGSSQTGDLDAKVNSYYNENGFVKTVETNPETTNEEVTTDEETTTDETTTEEITTEDNTTKSDETTTEGQTTKSDETTAERQTTKSEETTAERKTTKSDETTAERQTTKSDETTAERQTTKSDETTAERTTTKPDETTKQEETATVSKNDVKIVSFVSSKKSGAVQVGSKVKLTASAKSASGKKVSYRFTVKYSSKSSVIKNYTSKSYVSWTPRKAGKYELTVYAKSTGKAVKKTMTLNVNPILKVSGFSANVDSMEAYVGCKVGLSAKAAGGSKKYNYEFSYIYKGDEKVIGEFATAKKITWTPDKAGKYKLVVTVKDVKSEDVVTKSIKNYIVRKDNSLKVDYFMANRSSGMKLGKTVKFSTDSIGGTGNVKYRYSYIYSGEETIISDYSSKHSVKFTPDKAGVYRFVVTAKDSSGNIAKKNMYFVVMAKS